MGNKDLKRDAKHPQKRPDVWWYEENDGIYIVMEDRRYLPNELNSPVANTCKIKWASLRAALRRKDKK